VIGLRSAIMAAGARSVLMSLWPVDDEETRALMPHFYQSLWQKKMDEAAALQQAQLAVRNDPDHLQSSKAVYWAGWTLVDEGWR
jgi:CHAT domain-containing protein